MTCDAGFYNWRQAPKLFHNDPVSGSPSSPQEDQETRQISRSMKREPKKEPIIGSQGHSMSQIKTCATTETATQQLQEQARQHTQLKIQP